MGVVVVAVGIMAFVGIKSYGLEVRAQNDQSKLNDVKYDEIKDLLNQQIEIHDKMDHVDEDRAALPNPNADTCNILDEVFNQLTDSVESVSSYNVNSDDNTIQTMFRVKTLEDYVKLQAEIKENKFFKIEVPFGASTLAEEDMVEITHTFNVQGYGEDEETEEDSSYAIDINHGTNFDEMIESATN